MHRASFLLFSRLREKGIDIHTGTVACENSRVADRFPVDDAHQIIDRFLQQGITRLKDDSTPLSLCIRFSHPSARPPFPLRLFRPLCYDRPFSGSERDSL